MFCDAIGAIGGIRPAARFEMELEDPVLGRALRHAYDVRALPIVSPEARDRRGRNQTRLSRLNMRHTARRMMMLRRSLSMPPPYSSTDVGWR
jgi:Protein of unknown function (DUF2848)